MDDDGEAFVRFEYVYVGDRGVRGDHLHAMGLCDHTSELSPAFAYEVQAYERCGQCVNRAEELGLTIQPDVPLTTCPNCFLVGPCDCDN